MTLLERLTASLEQLGQGTGEDGVRAQLRGAAATEAMAKLRAWMADGSQLVNDAWDLADAADSPQLVALLRDLSHREAGVMSALALFQRHLENTLGERHGRGGIEDGDGIAIAAVDRSAASTKWHVDDAWPDMAKAIRKADRLPIGDPVDGELEDDTAKTLRLIKALCGVSYLRVEVCKELGLDPDDFRTKSGYRWVVKLP